MHPKLLPLVLVYHYFFGDSANFRFALTWRIHNAVRPENERNLFFSRFVCVFRAHASCCDIHKLLKGVFYMRLASESSLTIAALLFSLINVHMMYLFFYFQVCMLLIS